MTRTHLSCCHQHPDKRKDQWSTRSQLLQGSLNTACWPLEQQTGAKKEINGSQFSNLFHQKGPTKRKPLYTKSFALVWLLQVKRKCSPLFQLYSFLTSTLPLGLNGPFSENAPTPTDEQPGPTFTCMSIIRISLQEGEKKYIASAGQHKTPKGEGK